MKRKILTRTIWLLGFVSLFTDMASEMLYPVMPLYLESIGFSVLGIGVLEGFAQAVAGLSKGFFGQWSDRSARRLPFVQLGYSLSALSKPLMAVFSFPIWVFMARTTDRVGKGIRSAARDALLSQEATMDSKATVFGFHRSMDTLGATIGPLLALFFLWLYPNSYRALFLLAFFPGIAAIAATFLIKEKPRESHIDIVRPGFFEFLKYLRTSSAEYKKLSLSLFVFAFFNSSDLFLLMMLKESGLSDTSVIGFYIFYNLVYAIFAYPLGIISDKIGYKKLFISGLVLFSGVYFGMSLSENWWIFGMLFFGYGLYAASTEGLAKAWISKLSQKDETATAIGTYDGLSSVIALLSSSVAGLIWFAFGPQTMFIVSAAGTLGVAFYMLSLKEVR